MIKLNVGCGNDIQNGYINIDVRPLPNVVQMDICDLKFENNSVDEIRAIDVYEHISHLKSDALLKHWCEKLKPGGLLYVQAPHLRSLINNCLNQLNSGSLAKIENSFIRFFGGQDYPENTHLTLIDERVFIDKCRKAGFTGKYSTMTNFGNGTNIRIWIYK